NRKDHDLARRQGRLAGELRLRGQGRFLEPDAWASRRKRAPLAEARGPADVAAPRPPRLLAEEGRKAPLHVRLVVPAQRLVGDFRHGLAKAPLERRALLRRI